MEIGGLEKSTLIDYPGKIACTVFLIGCNFRCPWCYSAELVLPEKIKKQPKIKERDFFDFLQKRKNNLDGVVVCGGEPTIHPSLPQFFKKIKNLGFFVKLDTNGSNPEMVKELIKESLVDYIAMDIKAPLTNEKYKESTGKKIDISLIKKSIETIKSSKIDYEFRTTVIPGIHLEKDIAQIAREISFADKYFLQKFKPEKNIEPFFSKKEAYSEDCLEEIKDSISCFFNVCQVRY